LRLDKQSAQLTIEEISNRTWQRGDTEGLSTSTIRRALAGGVPRLAVATAITRVCGCDTSVTERHWQRARYEQLRAADDAARNWSVSVQYVRDYVGLYSALIDQYRKHGGRPYRELAALASAAGCPLSTSTLSRFLGGSAPRGDRLNRTFVLSFVMACGGRESELHEWSDAWDRAEVQRTGQARPATGSEFHRFVSMMRAARSSRGSGGPVD
jgi:hypothetical protein